MLTAGAIVVVAISGLLAVGIPFVGRMGLAAGVVVAVTAVAAVTVMPALLGMAGRRVLGRRGDAAARAGGLAERWARGVARRPVVSAAGRHRDPARARRAGARSAARPAGRRHQARVDDPAVAYDRLAEGFGAGFNGPLVLAVALPGRGRRRRYSGSRRAPRPRPASPP